MATIVTQSGRSREIPAHHDHLDPTRIVGLDPDGRFVVDSFGALKRKLPEAGDFLFGLTLCCSASDKGVEDGIVCRGCYRDYDTGRYLFRAADGGFSGLDPVKEVR